MRPAAAMFGAACRFRDTKGLNQPTSKLENCSRRHEENTASGTDGHEADEPGAPASLPASQQARIRAGRDAGAPGAGTVGWQTHFRIVAESESPYLISYKVRVGTRGHFSLTVVW